MGFKVPDNVISNDDISKIMDTSDEWIQSRSGIKERRWAIEEVTTSDLAFTAANNAIKNAEINNKEIDLVIVGTLSSDYFFQGVSAQLQDCLLYTSDAADE